MIIKDIRKEFFDVLKGRILIMCALDVDAICACKILQFLLESHNLQYSVAPVASADNLWKSFEEYRNSVDSIITINFGNLINISKLLKPIETLNFYVIDSHRPINVYNYYMNRQVLLYVNKNEDELKIPQKSKIFLKNDSGNEAEEDDEENLALLTADARDLTNEQLEKRRKLREWLQQKQKLMFDYEEFHFYNRAVSLIMYDLAYSLSKNNNYLLWLGIVGLTYQLKSEKISQTFFEDEAERLIRHISRNQVSSHARGNGWKINWQKDLQMDLYRRWTIYDSLWHTPLSVCKFQLWNDKGQKNLLEFLVECGLKLVQCKELYIRMKLDYKRHLLDDLQKVCLGDSQYKHNLQGLISRGFVMSCGGFKNEFSASDVVFAVRALLESHDPDSTLTEKFVRAIQSLSYDDFILLNKGCESALLNKGFEAARLQLRSMFEQVKSLITTQKVIDDGVLLYVDLHDQGAISKNFARGDSLMSFTRFLLNAYVSSKTSRLARRAIRLPMILLSPDYHDQDRVLVVGIPPIAQELKKNFFGKAFEQAAANINCEIKPDLSETNLIRANVNQKNKLLDQLKLLLE